MTPTSRQISENVVVLLLRNGMTNKDLADAIGMNRVSIGNRITGKTEWKAYEVDAVARALKVTTQELMGRLPDFKEWDRRNTAPAPVAATGGPRYLVMPEGPGDGTPPLTSVGNRETGHYVIRYSAAEAPRSLPRGMPRACGRLSVHAR